MVFDAMAQHKNGILALTAFREHIILMRKIEEKQLESGSTSATSFTGAKTLPSIKHATRMLIEEAMHRANNNQSIAASLLGISQQALSKRLKNLTQDK
jgi:transcriptional regulator with PAS, ATPase and Fis domain